MRYCITGMMPPLMGPATVEPLAATVRRLFFDMPSVRYSESLLITLDAALSPGFAQRPQSVADFRERLGGALREGEEEQETGEHEAPRLIQRVVAAVPPAPPRQRATARPEAVAPARDAEITAERDVRTVAPPRRALSIGAVIALAGAMALMAWHWRTELVKLAVDSVSSPSPAAPALPSAPAAVAVPEVAQVPDIAAAPVPVQEVPSLEAGEPKAGSQEDDRAEQAAVIPPPVPSPAPKPSSIARTDATTPRALCGRRTDFSLYRCMQQQCSQPKWRQHPQCLRLQATDRVD